MESFGITIIVSKEEEHTIESSRKVLSTEASKLLSLVPSSTSAAAAVSKGYCQLRSTIGGIIIGTGTGTTSIVITTIEWISIGITIGRIDWSIIKKGSIDQRRAKDSTDSIDQRIAKESTKSKIVSDIESTAGQNDNVNSNTPHPQLIESAPSTTNDRKHEVSIIVPRLLVLEQTYNQPLESALALAPFFTTVATIVVATIRWIGTTRIGIIIEQEMEWIVNIFIIKTYFKQY